MIDLYKKCERCENIKGAPFEAIARDFLLRGHKRRYYLCETCREAIERAIEDAIKRGQP